MESPIRNPAIKQTLHNLVQWAPLWLSTTVVFGGLGAFYALALKSDTWLASQAVMIREEANGAEMRLGRFQNQTDMKAAQETILELAKNHEVVKAALTKVGPHAAWHSGVDSDWPPSTEITQFAKHAISVHAPKGTEFGASEVIYIDVKQKDGQRALSLVGSLCDALEARLKVVRMTRADGVIAELMEARESARSELAQATSKLQIAERDAGSDLSDLRGMTDTIGGGGNARIQLDQMKSELRQAESTYQQMQTDLALLKVAVKNPAAFIVAPGALINSQPGLKRLREGVVDAQLNASQMASKYTESHPTLIAARATQSQVENRLYVELQAAIINGEHDIDANKNRIDLLKSQLASQEKRLEGLADSRADYSNIVAAAKTRATILEETERQLADVQAARRASESTSLVTRIDAPVLTDKPIGPGRLTIVGLSSAGGLLFGLGLVFLIAPISNNSSLGRRWSDYAGRGRRSSDNHAPNAWPSATPPNPASIVKGDRRSNPAGQASVPPPPIVEKAVVDRRAPQSANASLAPEESVQELIESVFAEFESRNQSPTKNEQATAGRTVKQAPRRAQPKESYPSTSSSAAAANDSERERRQRPRPALTQPIAPIVVGVREESS